MRQPPTKGDDALHAIRGLRAVVHGFVSLDAAGGFRLKRGKRKPPNIVPSPRWGEGTQDKQP